MAERLTKQQETAVNNRGGNLLVSAAAGSGKTKVLVDRLLSYMHDPLQPADIDEFLIITYTKAAAAELRGKIAAKISESVARNPENKHLQRQIQRLYLTKISTVHAFCSDLLREYSYLLDIPGDFRVSEETECLELQMRIIDRLLEDAYASENDSDFLAFADSQGLGRNDGQIPELILKVYNSARCHLHPDKWLEQCIDISDIVALTDVSETKWGRYLISDLHQYLDLQICAFQKCISLATASGGMEKPVSLLKDTLFQLEALRNAASWDEIRERLNVDYGRLVFSKKCDDPLLAEQIKAVRNSCKKGIEKRSRKFADCSQKIMFDISDTNTAVRGLIQFVQKFSEEYTKQKRSYRVLDFSDLEHKVLDLLFGKNRQSPTSVAHEISKRYREIMIDEYQDSNAVQDAIFGALTWQKHNCFMVGDVKQSIYQFRLANPDIFLEKYNEYVSADDAEVGQGRKVLLTSNFRSCGAVIDAVNDVFSTCMSKQVGGLYYGFEEALYEGVPHEDLQEPEIELHTIHVQQDTYAEEAAFTANHICELLNGEHYIRDGEGVRRVLPEDIVILLRSPGSVGGEFIAALSKCGIPCVTGGSEDLLKTEEVSTLYALLKIINNPLQDIPLTAVLMSRVFCFTADDMAALRSQDKKVDIYALLQMSAMPKAKQFVETITQLRQSAKLMRLPELLESILNLTKLDHAYATLPDGEYRLENLQAFYQIAVNYDQGIGSDLSRFLEYLFSLEAHGLSVSAEEKSSGAIRIMSIHKSKGLEFPVVYLCGLSREFNRESARAQVLCDRELGLGLSCVDIRNRIRYPSIAKSAISVKITNDGLSEELRVLYVAMTRAKDRLIMTYAASNICNELADIAMRLDICPPQLLALDADCPGKWILMTALHHAEAGKLTALAGCTPAMRNARRPWKIDTHEGSTTVQVTNVEECSASGLCNDTSVQFDALLNYRYSYDIATHAPSKMTATQLKGRPKDKEAAENSEYIKQGIRHWRKPSFITQTQDGKAYGNALHTAMQYISYASCSDSAGVEHEIARLVDEGYISEDCAALVACDKIAAFFETDIGKKLRSSNRILREFKFSILNDAEDFIPGLKNEKILMQGVIDCALIEADGITVIDFKTDRVTAENITDITEKYRSQVTTYAIALERIYQMPVKEKLIYYFSLNRFAEL